MTRRIRSNSKWSSLCSAAPLLVVAIVFSTFFILQSLPPTPSNARHRVLLDGGSPTIATSESPLGHYGELMLSFLQADLPFTLFIPTPSAFESIFPSTNNRSNSSGTVSANSSTSESIYAVVSRIFGFSAVPCHILSKTLALNYELSLESVSGFRLSVVRLPHEGTLMVNGLACITMDIIRGSIVVHLVDGILMDIDFEQSVMPYHDGVDADLGMV